MTPDTPTQAAALPPLPEPAIEDHPAELWGQNVLHDLFTADQMRDYAQQALQEACAERDALRADAERESTESDEAITLAAALEQQRALKIVEAVASLPIGGKDEAKPTPFHAGYQLACEEIAERLRTEVWELEGGITLPQAGTLPSIRQPASNTARKEGAQHGT